MQFVPLTWSRIGIDADGDGRKDPQDIDDATATAAAFLCANGVDLSGSTGRSAALYRYNPTASFVTVVTALAAGYAGTAAPVAPTSSSVTTSSSDTTDSSTTSTDDSDSSTSSSTSAAGGGKTVTATVTISTVTATGP